MFYAALLAALITCFFVPPDSLYFSYFDGQTLSPLFCMLAIIAGLHESQVFSLAGSRLAVGFRNARMAVSGLVALTALASMLITNDMALLTLLPLSFYVLTQTGQSQYLVFTFVLQALAANLGGMILPFGNPQNLYLFAYFQIPTSTFLQIMMRPFLVSIGLLMICCFLVPRTPLRILPPPEATVSKKKALVYGILFCYGVLLVLRLIPYLWGALFLMAFLAFFDPAIYKKINYPLLGTFLAFFVFSGNMARIPAMSAFLKTLVPGQPLLVSALTSQVISNVPAAVLLSQFTNDYAGLLKGVNIGGCGTLIASLASLIAYSFCKKMVPEKGRIFVVQFTGLNIAFFVVLLGVEQLAAWF